MSWPSPNAFREPEIAAPVSTTDLSKPSKAAIALSISAVTLPLLGGIVLSRMAIAELIHLGEASEELFRGDRLPLLKDKAPAKR